MHDTKVSSWPRKQPSTTSNQPDVRKGGHHLGNDIVRRGIDDDDFEGTGELLHDNRSQTATQFTRVAPTWDHHRYQPGSIVRCVHSADPASNDPPVAVNRGREYSEKELFPSRLDQARRQRGHAAG